MKIPLERNYMIAYTFYRIQTKTTLSTSHSRLHTLEHIVFAMATPTHTVMTRLFAELERTVYQKGATIGATEEGNTGAIAHFQMKLLT